MWLAGHTSAEITELIALHRIETREAEQARRKHEAQQRGRSTGP